MGTTGKYSHLQLEFEKGFLDKKWKSVTQFAIAKGIEYKNGGWKRATTGWTKKAEQLVLDLPQEAQERAKEKYIEQASKEWEEIYKNLGEASAIMSEKIKGLVKGGNFEFTDKNDDVRIDVAAVKGLMDAGLSAISLHKKTYVKEDIPLSIDSKHKIQEAKAIKEEDKGKDADSSVEDRIREKMKEHGFNK